MFQLHHVSPPPPTDTRHDSDGGARKPDICTAIVMSKMTLNTTSAGVQYRRIQPGDDTRSGNPHLGVQKRRRYAG